MRDWVIGESFFYYFKRGNELIYREKDKNIDQKIKDKSYKLMNENDYHDLVRVIFKAQLRIL